MNAPKDYECTCSMCENLAIEAEVSTGSHIISAFVLIGSIVLCAFLIFGCANKAYADNWTDEEVVNAIYKTENSKKYPYGIKSIKCNTVAECRQICLNSVRNARKRWAKAGKPEDFITFMGRRYSPPETNPNWVRLVNYFLRKARTT